MTPPRKAGPAAPVGSILIVSIAVAVLCGCAPKAYLAGQVTRMLDAGMTAFEADDDLDLLRNAFPADIKLLEALLASNPTDRRLLALLSRLYASYAFAFLETDLERSRFAADGCPPSPPGAAAGAAPPPARESVARYFDKGMRYGLRALQAGGAAWQGGVDRPDALKQQIAGTAPRDVPALFWYAFNLGALVRLDPDSIPTVSKAYIVQAAMQRVIDLDPSYYYGSAHLALMVYDARPRALGGDPSAARRHYDALKAIAGDDFLLADVYHARFLLHQQQDRAAFEKQLTAVVAHPEGSVPYRLLNQVARERARIYLDAVDCLFF